MKLVSVLAIVTCLLSLTLVMSAQSTQYPNELEGYKFFGNGKLKGLQLLASTKEDIKRIFGVNCEHQCDYDTNWAIEFQYFDEIWTREESNNKGDRRVYKLDPKYLGKLRQIDLRPKKAISFANVTFPGAFSKTIVTATSGVDARDPRGAGAVAMISDLFQDANGVGYEIFGQANPVGGSHKPGELVLIRYTIPKDREKSLFVLEK